jgi:hypothetical protein
LVDTAIRFLRLEALFGARLDQLAESHLGRLTTEQVSEDADLDFKKGLYAEAKKLDLATDVAAMANAQGGVIVLGIAELDGCAYKLNPLDLREDEDRRMREIVARNTAPVPQFRIEHVRSNTDEGKGYYVLLIPRSPHAPHAVRLDREGLRYPRRYGPQTIYLAEVDVANAYRSRFLEATTQVAQLDKVLHDGLTALRPPQIQEDLTVWTALALVPNNLGAMSMRVGTLNAFEEWARTGRSYFETPFHGDNPQASTGVRRIAVSDWVDSQTGRPHDAYGEFHTDGSGFVASRLSVIQGIPEYGQEELDGISDEALVASLTGMVALLVDHAVRHGGVHGDAIAGTSLLGPEPSIYPIALLHNRQHGMWHPLPRTRQLTTFPVSQHTISLDSVATSGQERLAAVRLLLTDLIQAFGFAEVLQIHPTGTLRARYWGGNHRAAVTRWTEAQGVQQVDTSVDQEV